MPFGSRPGTVDSVASRGSRDAPSRALLPRPFAGRCSPREAGNAGEWGENCPGTGRRAAEVEMEAERPGRCRVLEVEG